jgi:hypothetical protein
VNSSSSEDLPVIHVILAPHSEDNEAGEEMPTVEIHLPQDGSEGIADDEVMTDEQRARPSQPRATRQK